MKAEERTAARREIPAEHEAHASLRRDHPLEEARKNPHTVLEQQLAKSEEDLERPVCAQLLSGLSAGLDLGFGPLTMAVVITLTRGRLPEPVTELLVANTYALGFILVVMGGSMLFTEQTTSAVQPVLARRASIGALLRVWGLVLLANLVGATLFAAVAAHLGPALGIVEPYAFGEMARKMVEHSWSVMLLSAIAAGWLMGMLVWLVAGARDTVSQIFFVWLTTFTIGILGLHHSIAGTLEVLMGVFAGEGATMGDYGRFILWSVLGNLVGGSLFVAGLKYAHIRSDVR